MQNESKNENHSNKLGLRKKLKGCRTFFIGAVIGFCLCVTKPFESGWGIPSIFTKADTVLPGENSMLTVSTVEEILKPASDLISMRYCYTDADVNENFKSFFGNRIPFTTDKVVFTYDGIISVGVDLSSVAYEIDDKNKVISMELPELKIISNEIDASSFEYPYKSDSIFNSTDMSDYTDLIDVLKQKKAEDVKNNIEFMKAAEENAKNVLKSFLTQAESTKEYAVNFK